MKRFDIITEIDARVLLRGETVVLARGGHITPLAQDTLKERRVTVVDEGRVSSDDASLAPPADVRAVAIASDHTGIALRRQLVAFLRGRGLAVQDLGTDSPEAVDYPDVAASVARLVARGEADAGIVIDGAGIGSAIAANKVRGVRAVMATTETIACYSRE
jgi:ribose 5-phosphate isomerase B